MWIAGRYEGRPITSTRSAHDGRFTLKGVPVRLGVMLFAAAPELGRGAALLPRGARRQNLRLWAGCTLNGRIVDEDGAAIAGAQVWATFESRRGARWHPDAEARSAEDGTFELQHAPVGDVVIRAAARGHIIGERRLFVAKSTAVGRLVLWKGVGARVRVKVEGAPDRVAGVAIELGASDWADNRKTLSPIVAHGLTDKNGEWSVSGLPLWKWNVAAATGESRVAPSWVAVPGGRDPPVIRMRLKDRSPAETKVKGRLRHKDGSAAANLHIEWTPMGPRRPPIVARTDRAGRFELTIPGRRGKPGFFDCRHDSFVLELVPRFHLFSTIQAHRAVTEVALAYPEKTLEFVLRPAGRVRGVVLGNAKPARGGVPLELVEKRDDWWQPFAWTTSDNDGRFDFRKIRCDPHEVRVRRRGDPASESKSFFVREGQQVRDVTVKVPLVPKSSIEGRLVDKTGKPQAGARVWLKPTGRRVVDEVVTDGEGRFRFLDVSAGEFELQVVLVWDRVCKLSEGRGAFRAEPGETTRRQLRLR